MRLVSMGMLALGNLVLAADGSPGEAYLTKDGKLTQPLKIVELQGGFAGFTGTQFTIATDGSWSSDRVFREKLTPKGKGKLSAQDLAKVAAILQKYDLDKLPEKSGKQPGANPHTVTIEYGKKKADFVGQIAPKVDPANPTKAVESRFAGILEGVVGLLTPEK